MKSYIIRLDNHALSTTLAADCFKASNTFGLTPEYFKAIDRYTVDNFFNRHGLSIAKDKKMALLGTRGCFASHYSIWIKVLEEGQSAVILEHDGLLIKSVNSITSSVVDVCHLDPYDPYTTSYNNDVLNDNGAGLQLYKRTKEKRITGKYFRGAYGYILTPQGANKLISFVKEYGAFSADRSICENAALLQSTMTTHVRLHPFFENAITIKNFSTRKSENGLS
jgi:GR25 family glycosyltransferase involved in LPS biosynthesis